jgi:hypothetical protein
LARASSGRRREVRHEKPNLAPYPTQLADPVTLEKACLKELRDLWYGLEAALELFAMTKAEGYVEAGTILKPLANRMSHIMIDEIDVDRLLEKGGSERE